jgi:hypothetical protein
VEWFNVNGRTRSISLDGFLDVLSRDAVNDEVATPRNEMAIGIDRYIILSTIQYTYIELHATQQRIGHAIPIQQTQP